MPLRIIFCGTPAFAVPTLRHLIAQPDFQIEAVVTQPDRPRGRGREIALSAVKQCANEAGLPVYQPQKIKSPESLEYFRRLAPDVVVIIAYGQIISAPLIAIPRLGWINLHASLLPKYRGAAPINWAIVNGETLTGLTTMQIDPGLDTGPVLLNCQLPIGPHETAPELNERLAQAGPALMAATLRGLVERTVTPAPQDNSRATLAPMLRKEEGRIDWSLPAPAIYNRIRGLQPWPGTFTQFRGANCHIWGRPAVPETAAYIIGTSPGRSLVSGSELLIACGDQTALALESLQLEGRKRVSVREFLNGAHLSPGEPFGPNAPRDS